MPLELAEALAWASKIKDFTGKIFSPKDKKESKNLDDSSFRQTNVFSKTTNIFVIKDRDTGEKYIGDINTVPPEVIGIINKQYDIGTKPRNQIRLIRNDFAEDIEEYSKHYEKPHKVIDKISPYLTPEYRSILRLATYAESLINKAEHAKAQKVKDDIGYSYGRRGRKLCNLYTQSYVTQMINYYSEVLSEAKDKEELKQYINGLVSLVIEGSEYVFFVNPSHKKEELARQIISAMEKKVGYIALHSAGSSNIRKTEVVLEMVSEKIEELGYDVKPEKPPITSSLCPTFNVYITKLEEK